MLQLSESGFSGFEDDSGFFFQGGAPFSLFCQ